MLFRHLVYLVELVMCFFLFLTALALVGPVFAAVPHNSTICDYYASPAFAGNLTSGNEAADQLRGMVELVNIAFAGNQSETTNGIKIPGILKDGNANGTTISLRKYFNGSLLSTNRDGRAVSVNFLDGGDTAPFQQFYASTPENTNQYKLFRHFYSFYGNLLGCSGVGRSVFPAYDGRTSMYAVHQYMSINPIEIDYFLEQFALTALAFGADPVDVHLAKEYSLSLFAFRCSPPVRILEGASIEPQAICDDPLCPLAANANCSAAKGYTLDGGTSPEPAAAIINTPSVSLQSSNPTESTPRGPSATATSAASILSFGWEIGIGSIVALGF